MTRDPRTVNASDTIVDAARVMNEADIGDVIVVDNGDVTGHRHRPRHRRARRGRGPRRRSRPRVGDICTSGIEAIEPGASVDDALRKMRDADIRRLPVVEDGRPVGIVSLGDLAVEREPDSTLADISAASPDN